MNELARKKCKPCEGGVAPLTREQVAPMLKGLQGWSLDGKSIAKTYRPLRERLHLRGQAGRPLRDLSARTPGDANLHP
jgi:hypothetical protein